jgi:hypothetical protein
MKRSLREQFLEVCKKRRLNKPVAVVHEASAKCEFKSECYYKTKYGVRGFNKPKRLSNHPTKSHMVVARFKDGSGNYQIKVIYFGQKGVHGEGKPSPSDTDKERKRRAAFKARHAQNISKGPSSAAYWANKIKW